MPGGRAAGAGVPAARGCWRDPPPRPETCLVPPTPTPTPPHYTHTGGTVACEGVEVSPLVSYAGEGLAGVAGGRAFGEPFSVHLQASPPRAAA